MQLTTNNIGHVIYTVKSNNMCAAATLVFATSKYTINIHYV